MPPNTPLNFTNVEALRAHMLLTSSEFAKALDVSRVTYSGWVSGKKMRSSNEEKVKNKLRKMLKMLTEETEPWPTPQIIAMSGTQRLATLLEKLKAEE